MSGPLSVRLSEATISRLGTRARRLHLPPRTLAQRYVEEGLRMDEHPLVRFADGPAGLSPNNLRDCQPLHSEAITPGGHGHFGMIFMPGSYRRTRADTGRIIAALEAKLVRYPGEKDLAHGEAWL